MSARIMNHTVKMATGLPGNFARARSIHMGVVFVPQREAWIVERFGKFNRILDPGLNLAIPLVERVAYKQSLKEIILEIEPQSAITNDNVTLDIDGVLFARVIDPFAASYGVDDPELGIVQLSQTNLRSEIGKITLDKLFQERQTVSMSIVDQINQASKVWGIECLRYEIKNVKLPEKVKVAMQQQVEADRQKRAKILLSEAQKQSDINIAEGKRQSKILESEASRMEKINIAQGEAEAQTINATAQAEALSKVGHELGQSESNKQAAAFNLGLKYMEAFSNIAKETNSVIIPSDINDGSKMLAQGMTLYKSLFGKNMLNQGEEPSSGGTNQNSISSNNSQKKKP